MRPDSLLLLALLGLAACGGSGDTKGGAGSCSVAFSGAYSGSLDCTVAMARMSSTGETAIAISDTSGASGAFLWTGSLGTLPPAPGTFTRVSAQGSGELTVGSSSWGQTSSLGGAFQLVLTAVETGSSSATATAYAVDGTLDTTLQPLSGSGGNVAVHAAF